MKFTVHYFGLIAEKVTKKSEEVELQLSSEKLDLHEFFEELYPTLRNLNYQIAVNQELNSVVDASMEITEIALLPPFAGG